jgi:phytol kinase
LSAFGGPLIIVIWLVFVVGLALTSRQLWPHQQELSRKVIHIGTGAVVPLAWLFAIPAVVAIPCAAVITLITAINHQWRFIAAIEEIDRKSYGTIAYGFAITVLLVLFWPHRPDAVTAGVLVMALGDGLAGLVGRQLKTPEWMIFEQKKSVAGTLTMAVVSIFVLIILSTITNQTVLAPVAIAIALGATGLEQISMRGIDNLTVPLGVGLAWSTLIP